MRQGNMFAAELLVGSAEKFTAQSPPGHRGGVWQGTVTADVTQRKPSHLKFPVQPHGSLLEIQKLQGFSPRFRQ